MVFLKVRHLSPEFAAKYDLTNLPVYTVWPNLSGQFPNPSRERIEAARAFCELRLLTNREEKLQKLRALGKSDHKLIRDAAIQMLDEP